MGRKYERKNEKGPVVYNDLTKQKHKNPRSCLAEKRRQERSVLFTFEGK